MFGESCLAHYGGSITANQHRFAGHKRVMVIEREPERMIGNGSEVISNLTIIFANVFERPELKGPDSHRIEIDHSHPRLHLGVSERDPRFGNKSKIGTANFTQQAPEVFDRKSIVQGK